MNFFFDFFMMFTALKNDFHICITKEKRVHAQRSRQFSVGKS